MKLPKKLPYREAIPFLLKQKNWSYRKLDKATGISGSYWSQTVTGRQGVPKNPEVFEKLAKVFGVKPDFFAEYNQAKAAQLVMKDPSAAYLVVSRESQSRPVPFKGLDSNYFQPKKLIKNEWAPPVAKADFAAIISGNYFKEWAILDKDIIYLRKQEAEIGDLVLVERSGKIMLQKVAYNGKLVGPKSDKVKLEDKLDKQKTKILGVQVGLLRLYKSD
jgi:transcriptional regulator with XRE-family HTH domain